MRPTLGLPNILKANRIMPPTIDIIYLMFVVIVAKHGLGVVERLSLPTNFIIRIMTRHFINKTMTAH
jgi:hypothetical protein